MTYVWCPIRQAHRRVASAPMANPIDEQMAHVLRELDAYNRDPTREQRDRLREAARRLHPNVGPPRAGRPGADAAANVFYKGHAVGDLIRLLDDHGDH